ncbi:alkane 1-monooxygenase [Algirhabdus cladophorae]|uniref:alkane 1-monooxygenase n=1 Tax=Algirhabdus cladophorae TaxID=3377108 RepID=UPI003B84A91B
MTRPVLVFAAATLVPVALLACGALMGGGWLIAACLYLTLFTASLDELIQFASEDAPDGAEFPAADGLSAALALSHFMLWPLAVSAISGANGAANWEQFLALICFGLFFGQVSNSNAHELIHKTNYTMHSLGKWVYISLLFGHHTSAHVYIHHRHVGTRDDPQTARFGESFYRYAVRAWRGSFKQGLIAENRMQRMRYQRLKFSHHPYTHYLLGALVMLGFSLVIGGWAGLAALLALAGYAQTQLLLSDYVQHYGLKRQIMDNGKVEPIGIEHSWNAPHFFSSALMLNAPRHSDHHAHPSKNYASLALPGADEAPMLPRSLPVMAVVALFPPFWRKVMDPLAMQWQPETRDTLSIAAQ